MRRLQTNEVILISQLNFEDIISSMTSVHVGLFKGI
jgi:hypothetical protein